MPESVYLVSAIALAVSIIFGLSNHIQQLALVHMNVRTGTIVNVATTLLILLVLAPTYLDTSNVPLQAIGWFALAGVIVPSLSMTLHTMSIRQLGPAISSALTSTSPVFAIILALIFLGERGDLNLFIGTAIIISSIAFIALRSRRLNATWPLVALLIPLGAALCRAVAHNVVKFGLFILPNPMAAALVSSAVSLVVLVIWHKIGGRGLPSWNKGYWWFGLCGLLNAIGLVGLNTALEMGTVTLVAPLVSTTPAFTLLLGWLIFRKEVVGWQTVIAMTVIFAGCLLIILR